ncbi:MAG: hypothetical protein KA444_04955 [Bacteroidia bacterium]|nr:hypothetical protein [Bacteroidia bacterium]
MKAILSILVSGLTMLTASAQKPAETSGYGKNIISFSPIQITAINPINDERDADVCVNFSYERISENEAFGFKLPVSFSLKDPYYYIMPVLKIYPFKQGVVKYAIGPQFYFGFGEIERRFSSYNYPYTPDTTINVNKTQVGFMINHSLNFSIMQNFYMGIEASLGINYYDSNKDEDYQLDSYYYPDNYNDSQFYPAFHMGFAMGYRF